MERISGPVNGFYIATFACPVHDREYVGQARICRTRPRSFWEAAPLAEFIVPRPSASRDLALVAALSLAVAELSTIAA